MIDALFMPIIKCVLSVFIWTLVGSVIGLGVNYIHGVDGLNLRASQLYLMDLDDWCWAIAITSLIGMFTIFMIILNLKIWGLQ